VRLLIYTGKRIESVMTESQKQSQQKIWQVVHQIPAGKVASYGQIARLAGMPSHSRLVGRILSKLPADTNLPWHRVVNSQGRITNPAKQRQIERLNQEGISLINGRVNLRLDGWDC
jgi:methylated-DNA-protein-cysteine methyltransferase-like protein